MTGYTPREHRPFSFYGHYDVQPVDVLDEWESPSFEATVRAGEIYARGAADDKGQIFMHFKTIEACLKQDGGLPVNIKLILEGEEEVGSENLDAFLNDQKSELAADVVVISDTPMFDCGVPSICYGLRGLTYCQIDLRGTNSDLHVTHRPATEGDTVQRQTQRWLVEHGFEWSSVIVQSGSRGQLADTFQLDFLVDDTVEHCVNAVAESKTKPILILCDDDAKTETNANRLGIAVCRSVAECLDFLVLATRKKNNPSSLQRVTKKIGL